MRKCQLTTEVLIRELKIPSMKMTEGGQQKEVTALGKGAVRLPHGMDIRKESY